MFTGIIEEVGCVKSLVRGATSAVISIRAEKVLEGTKIGDSICVSGVCLTVTSLDQDGFAADVMPETLSRSILGSLSAGSFVNLERALLLTTRLGGHIVSGHIDGVGTIFQLKRADNAVVVSIDADPTILRLVVEKGSIAINGISLTVVDVDANHFSVSVIPHTLANTDLARAQVGTRVNLECDIIGKYVERLMTCTTCADPSTDSMPTSSITREMLIENGF